MAVVLADPETVIAQFFAMLGQRERLTDGDVLRGTGNGYGLIKDRKLEEMHAQTIASQAIAQSQESKDCSNTRLLPE